MIQNYPLSRKSNLVVQELNGEVLIYDLNKNKAFCLNETSALIWQLCDGNKSVAEISQAISKKLDSPANEDLVWFAIDQFKTENLIENGDILSNHFNGISRRDVIKKVGLGTMIALPIVAGVLAPTSAMAQSCGHLQGTCASTSDCCVGSSLSCNSGLCCNGTGTIITGGTANVPNPIGNCGAGGVGARDAVCDAACCNSAASGTVANCTAATLQCACA